ncbi:MAG: DUF2188 domain-containing protein [Thermomicrobiales bacterium]
MPWTRIDYPATFKNMRSDVREKAIDIANELLDQYEEPRAIRIATAQAKEWARNRNIEIWTDEKPTGKDQHVLPHDRGWAVQAEESQQATKVFRIKEEALDRARDIARNQNSNVVIHAADGKISDVVQP